MSQRSRVAVQPAGGLTSFEVYDQLTATCGWTGDDYRDWLTTTLLP
ncbi:hypothetical protein [Dactylosporangium sp. NPDC000521]